MENKISRLVNEWLVLSFQAGNKAALNLLVKRWHKILIKNIHSKTQNLEVAKDIAQDCWVVVIHSIHRLQNPADFGAWLMKIASNKSIDYIRKKGLEQKFINTSLNNKESLNDHPDYQQAMIRSIQIAFEKLPLKDRRILYLYYSMDLPVLEIAKQLNLKEGTVKSRLFTARNHLKIKFNHHE